MGLAYHLANVISIALFLYYGLACLFANGMIDEFRRYGLSRFRRATGAFEVLGAAGLVAGYFLPAFSLLSAGGLCDALCPTCACDHLGRTVAGVRRRIGDNTRVRFAPTDAAAAGSFRPADAERTSAVCGRRRRQ